MLNRQTTPEEVARVADQFVLAYRHSTPMHAYTLFKELRDYMDAVYWPNPLTAGYGEKVIR